MPSLLVSSYKSSKVGKMDTTYLLSQLEGLAYKLGMEIRYEAFGTDTEDSPGGYCRLGAKKYIIVNKNLPLDAQVMVIALALKHFDLEDIYVRPAVRDFLDSAHGDSLSRAVATTFDYCANTKQDFKKSASHLKHGRLLWSSKEKHR